MIYCAPNLKCSHFHFRNLVALELRLYIADYLLIQGLESNNISKIIVKCMHSYNRRPISQQHTSCRDNVRAYFNLPVTLLCVRNFDKLNKCSGAICQKTEESSLVYITVCLALSGYLRVCKMSVD